MRRSRPLRRSERPDVGTSWSDVGPAQAFRGKRWERSDGRNRRCCTRWCAALPRGARRATKQLAQQHLRADGRNGNSSGVVTGAGHQRLESRRMRGTLVGFTLISLCASCASNREVSDAGLPVVRDASVQVSEPPDAAVQDAGAMDAGAIDSRAIDAGHRTVSNSHWITPAGNAPSFPGGTLSTSTELPNPLMTSFGVSEAAVFHRELERA